MIKRILVKIIRKLLFIKPKSLSSLEIFLSNGNLKHGINCKFEGFEVASVGQNKDFCNVSIGNNCYLCCTIMLQRPEAKITIGDGVYIGPGTILFCYDEMVFNDNIMVSWGCTFIDTNAHSLHSNERRTDVSESMKGPQFKNWSQVKSSPIVIKDKCWIGFNSIILKGVTLEQGTILGAGSVISKSTQQYGVYAGNPAIFIKMTD